MLQSLEKGSPTEGGFHPWPRGAVGEKCGGTDARQRDADRLRQGIEYAPDGLSRTSMNVLETR